MLLVRHVPAGWLVEGMAGAVSVLVAANAGCGAAQPGTPRPPAPPAAAVVAPVFEHGDGIAAEGCIVIAPPVFLSEEEGLGVVLDALRKAGVRIERTRAVWSDVLLPERMTTSCGHGPPRVERERGLPLTIDGLDRERQIAFKYVSHRNYTTMGGPRPDGCSVTSYHLKAVAKDVVTAVRQQHRGGVYFGAFYDPAMATWEPRGDGKCEASDFPGDRRDACLSPRKAAARGRELLRQQVRDFVQWLKAQGAI